MKLQWICAVIMVAGTVMGQTSDVSTPVEIITTLTTNVVHSDNRPQIYVPETAPINEGWQKRGWIYPVAHGKYVPDPDVKATERYETRTVHSVQSAITRISGKAFTNEVSREEVSCRKWTFKLVPERWELSGVEDVQKEVLFTNWPPVGLLSTNTNVVSISYTNSTKR